MKKKDESIEEYFAILKHLKKEGVDAKLVYNIWELEYSGFLPFYIVYDIIDVLGLHKKDCPGGHYIWDMVKFFTLTGIEVYPKNDKKLEDHLATLFKSIVTFQREVQDLEEYRMWFYDSMHHLGTVNTLDKDYRKDANFKTSKDWSTKKPHNLYDAMHPVEEDKDESIEFIHI